MGLFVGTVGEKGSRERCSSSTVLHAESSSALSSGFRLSQGNAEALDNTYVRQENKASSSYFLSKASAKNCHNRIVYVKIIASQK